MIMRWYNFQLTVTSSDNVQSPHFHLTKFKTMIKHIQLKYENNGVPMIKIKDIIKICKCLNFSEPLGIGLI